MGTAKEIQVDISGKLYTLTSDDNYLRHIQNCFEPEMVKLLRTVARDSEVILDVGANIGCTALLFGELSKKVYAFEPSQLTFKFLEKNILNSNLKNIFPQNMGLGAELGEYPLTYAPSDRSGAFVSNKTQASAGHTVEKIIIRQMDEVLDSLNISRVDFIKIDVEGFEGEVLRGAKQTLANNKPTVILELNHWCLNLQRTSVPDFFDLLRSMFPILLAVDGPNYLNLYDESETYVVMNQNILHMRFPNIVAAFDEHRLDEFKALYRHHFEVEQSVLNAQQSVQRTAAGAGWRVRLGNFLIDLSERITQNGSR
jgi:FkbM family methyltransferase